MNTPPPEPLLVSRKVAAVMLSISVSKLDQMIRRGVLSRAKISTRNHLLHVDELRTLADQGELAVRELRLRKKRLNPSA